MFGNLEARPRRRSAMAIAVVASFSAVTAVAAQEGPVPANVTLFPGSGTNSSGSCSSYYVTVTDQNGQPVQGATIDVLQVLEDARTEPEENRELYFCDPSPSHPRNPTGQGDTAVRNITGNEPSQAGEIGRNTRVRAEVGPTDADGEVAFGITIAPDLVNGNVSLTAWADLDGDDQRDEGEPWDASAHQWVHAEFFLSSIDAGPEGAANPNGTHHTVTVVAKDHQGFPVQGFVPDSVILTSSFAADSGDVVDPLAGSSPNRTVPGEVPDAYSCTPTNSQGFSTCTFQDPAGTPPGTDTVVFFWDRAGQARMPDGPDPRDAVQKTWTPVEQGPPCPTPIPTQSPAPSSSPTPSPSVSPSVSPSPTPAPSPGAAGARNIRLCQGSSAAPCDTSSRMSEPGDLHEVAALVTDRNGVAVANVPVEFRQSGPARFTATGTASVVVVTANDGVARALMTSEDFGTSTIVAEVSPPGAPGSFRGPGPADDECEQPAGPGGAPPAGNCVSQPLTVIWDEAVNGHECDDGIDNDGDGFIDFGEDPGCLDEADGSEEPFNPAETPLIRHPRTISMHFRDANGEQDGRLVVSGRLRLAEDGDAYRRCIRGRQVKIQRLVDEWVTKDRDVTNRRGRYSGTVPDVVGTYRAVAVPAQFVIEDVAVHNCQRADKEKPHRHVR